VNNTSRGLRGSCSVVITMVMDHLHDIVRDVDDPDLDCEETLQSIKARATAALGLLETMRQALED
jgi:hypothetical protein